MSDDKSPKVLGVEMTWNGMIWSVKLGPLTATIAQSSAEDFLWSCAHKTDWTHSVADCVAAIERELLAIKSAIPDAPGGEG